MEQIGVYFKKFEGLGNSEREIKKCLLRAILSVLGQDVSDIVGLDMIEINNDKIKLKVIGPVRNEIALNKNKIEEVFKDLVLKKKEYKII